MEIFEEWKREVERIVFSTLNPRVRIVGLTAPFMNSGVSTIACHMARMAASSGTKTLLLDFTNKSETLEEGETWEPGINHAEKFVSTRHEGYDLLVAHYSSKTRYLFNSVARLRKALDEDLAPYKAIIVDAPPVPASNDERLNGLAIIGACDLAVLVAMSGVITKAQLIASQDAIKTTSVPLAGLVLNEMHSPSLGSEFAREVDRFSRIAPKLTGRLKKRLLASRFLN